MATRRVLLARRRSPTAAGRAGDGKEKWWKVNAVQSFGSEADGEGGRRAGRGERAARVDGADAQGELRWLQASLCALTSRPLLPKTWINPVFPSSKPGIPSLTSHKLAHANSTPLSTGQPLPTSRPSRASLASDIPSLPRSRLSTLSAFFSNPSAAANANKSAIADLPADVRGAGQRFTREDLGGAEFVAQVDRKFLLVKMRGRAELDHEEGGEADGRVETLVMVDQHAASERVRVEKLLEKLCGKVARGEEVELWPFVEGGKEGAADGRGCAVLVSAAEAVQAAERIENFARWGIGLDLPSKSALSSTQPANDDSPPRGDYVQIHLTSVPLIVSDRLRVEPRLQQELVRSYLAQLAEQGGGAAKASRAVAGEGNGGDERTWRSVVRQCPPVLLDLVNSKACRGAIMFNDGELARRFSSRRSTSKRC